MIKPDYRQSKQWPCALASCKALMCLLVAWAVMVSTAVPQEPSVTGGEPKSAYACEDDQLVLGCQVGEVIRILRANYGRFTISVCNRHGQTDGWNLQCMLPKAKDIVSERCDGRQECEMRVSSHVFGDPCPLTSKYVEVKYSCHRAVIETPYVQTTVTATTPAQPKMPLNGSPKPPHITYVTALSPTQIEVMWTHPEPFSSILTTAVYIKDTARKTDLPVVYAKLLTSLLVDKLRPNTTYSISLKNFNNHGPSVTSNTVNITTLPFDESYLRSTTSRTFTADQSHVHDSTKQHLSITERPSFSDDITLRSTTIHPPSTHKPGLIFPDSDLSSDFHPSSYPGASNDDEKIDSDDNVNGVVDKFCVERMVRGIVWPETSYGRSAEKSCPEGLKGMTTWQCLDYGWDKTGPDFSDCTSPWMEKIDAQINSVMRGEEPADQASVALSEVMTGQELTAGDLKKASLKLLPKLAKGLQREDPSMPISVKLRRMAQFKKAFISSTSILLSKKNFRSWRNLTRQDRRRAATSLILAVEDTGFRAASLVSAGTSEVTVAENIIMEVNVMDTQQTHSDITFPYKKDLENTPWASDADSGSITLRSTSLKVIGMKGPINIVFTMYKNMEDLIQPQLNTISTTPASTAPSDSEGYHSAGTDMENKTLESSETGTVRIINSKIIAASISSTAPRRKLAEPVIFTLRHLEPRNEGKPLCSFWDMDTRTTLAVLGDHAHQCYLSGQWSQDGCKLLDTNTTHTTCECDHLTNFAILMDVVGVKLSQDNELALRLITFVGCVISMICLTLSWITFLVFKNLHCDRNTIHRNLVLCLLLAEIVFLSGIAQTEPKILCSIIAGVLHYLFLSTFAWMSLEGIQLYIMLVEVFEQEKSRVHWYYLFGYGIPAVVVAISVGVYHDGYGTNRHCWLTTENYFIWSFVGPALAVMLINIVMLSIATYTMCRHSTMSVATRAKSKVTKLSVKESFSVTETVASPNLRFPDLPVWVKGSIVLVVLLGLTWLLGVVYLNEESIVVAYFFTVLNSLQGLFIFVFHCLKNEKVQKEYRKVARRTSWLPNCIRVNYGGYTGETSSSLNGSSGSGNYISKLFRQKGNKHLSAPANNSSKPFLSKDQQGQSDTENTAGGESSNVPSSLNGYMYNPSCSNSINGHAKTPFLNSHQNVMVQSLDSRQDEEENGYESVQEMVVNLPEYMDCSVVGSKFVPDYCTEGMQFSRGETRSSTDSEYSYSEKPMIPHYYEHGVNSSAHSTASSSRKPSPCVSSSKILDRSFTDDPDKDIDEKLSHRPLDHRLNLHQYVIPASRKNGSEEMQNISDQLPRADYASASMNQLCKPASSISSFSKTENFPQIFGIQDRRIHQSVRKPVTNTPDGIYMSQDSTKPVYKDGKTYTGMSSSAKANRSNSDVNGPSFDDGYADPISVSHRYPSHVTFSTFKFT